MLRKFLFMVLLFLASAGLTSKLTRGPSSFVAAAALAGALAAWKRVEARARSVGVAVVAGAVVGCFASLAHGALEDQEAIIAAADRRQAAREQQARLASIPTILQRADGAIAGADWPAADSLLRSIRQIQPDHPGLSRRERLVGPELEALRQRQREEARAHEIEDGVALARRVVGNPSLCERAKAIGEAWDKLRRVRQDDGEFDLATKLSRQLEACRRRVARQLSEQVASFAATQRRRFARDFEARAVDSGMSIEASAAGAHSDELVVKWVLANRTTIARLDPDGRLAEALERGGFRRVTFTNGFGMTVSNDLADRRDPSVGSTVMTSLGLGQPLALAR